MKSLSIVTCAMVLAGCGGSGGGAATDEPRDANDFSRYTTSLPLADNADAATYTVLLMGNSHAAGLRPVLSQLLVLGQPGKLIDVQSSPKFGWLADLVNDGLTEQALESEAWTHVILQGQKYSSTGSLTYPTDAAEYWIRGSKEQGATPILFPEHPTRGNDWEGQSLWELHSGIATRENTCVAPVGLVWDEVVFKVPLRLHEADGNHASDAGLLLTALVFYQIITGQPVETLPELSAFGIDAATEQIMKESVSGLLFTYSPCNFEL